MPVLTFRKFMAYQSKAMMISGLDPLQWIDKNAARFRRSVERHFIIK